MPCPLGYAASQLEPGECSRGDIIPQSVALTDTQTDSLMLPQHLSGGQTHSNAEPSVLVADTGAQLKRHTGHVCVREPPVCPRHLALTPPPLPRQPCPACSFLPGR